MLQELRKDPSLKRILAGSSRHFVIVITDAGFQFVGKLKLAPQIYKDLKTLLDEVGAVFLGKFYFNQTCSG